MRVFRRPGMTSGAIYWLLIAAYLLVWGKLSVQSPLFFDDGALFAMADARNAGATWFAGVVENRPPLLTELIAWTFSLSPRIATVKWLSVAVFGILLVVVYATLKRATRRNDLAYCGVTLIAANLAIRHYAVVEMSSSFWQAMVCLLALLVIFVNAPALTPDGGRKRATRISLAAAGALWAVALWLKQQAVVGLAPVIVLVAMSSPGRTRISSTGRALAIFAAGAALAGISLYFLILPQSSWHESYKYLIEANVARNDLIEPTNGWIERKASAVIAAILMAARVPVAALLCLETMRVLATFNRGRWPRATTHGAPAANDSGELSGYLLPLQCALIAWGLAVLGFYSLQIYAQLHYLVEIGICVALVCPLLLANVRRYRPTSIAFVNIGAVALLVVWHGMVRDPIDVEDRRRAVTEAYVASVIRTHSTERDRVLVFGPPGLYHLSQRVPASRFPFFVDVWTTPVLVEEYRASIEQSLDRETTKVVVIDEKTWRLMPASMQAVVSDGIRAKYHQLAIRAESEIAESYAVYVRESPG